LRGGSPGVLSKWEGRGEVVYVSDRPCEASDAVGEGCEACNRKKRSLYCVLLALYERGSLFLVLFLLPTEYLYKIKVS
jgi:hypothetical protein